MITRRQTHIAIIILSGFGLLLSGYLSYVNLWGPGCSQGFLSGIISCGGPTKVLIWGYPTCVYGFAMYLAIFLTNVFAWSALNPRPFWNWLLGLTVLGTAFAGGLTIYELFILNLKFSALPACVYGLVLYGGMLGVLLAQRQRRETLLTQ
jgi:hypothetical protein